ncbi:myosin v [Plasmopara halstedii]|uniref:Myosin v n=1 Tax=Plasmopara halstedii TaxID=4781 RepID=A0A0P1B665_PLAHL|nr:myosin v [Plasmopara halstedii]CEG49906.1 myosin v [Plasmopara halstedii]|eukprot:XP_024586275.1 myosin v [Plasmopara halstedii]
MKRNHKLSNALLSTETAWYCAAEFHKQVEGKERSRSLSQLSSDETLLQDQHSKWSDISHMPRNFLSQGHELATKAEIRSNNNETKGRIYSMENLRLAMLMKDTKLQERAKKYEALMLYTVCVAYDFMIEIRKKARPRIVQDMLALERRYAETACKVQKWWRAHLHQKLWRLYMRQCESAVLIQCLARGFLTRRWAHIWHANREMRITKVQALFRGHFVRNSFMPNRKRWERFNASKIQSAVRKYLAHRLFRQCQRETAALHIQSCWRSIISRRKSDICWLDDKSIVVQRCLRGTLARRLCRQRVIRDNKAIIVIQRICRGIRARNHILTILRHREVSNRQVYIAVLKAEEEWHRAQRDKLQVRLSRNRLKERVAQLEFDYSIKHEHIHDMERLYLDMQTQRMRMSPRAIEHGWVEELEAKLKQQRALITELKHENIFELGLELKFKEKELTDMLRQITLIEEKRQQFETWQNEEYADCCEYESRIFFEEKIQQRRQRVAEIRRQWQYQFYPTNGKRDSRWRGSCRSLGVIDAAREKNFTCSGFTDVSAQVQGEWLRPQVVPSNKQIFISRVGTNDIIGHLADQVALTVATAQIEQIQVLFDPVSSDVERTSDKIRTL